MTLKTLDTNAWEIGIDEVGRGCLWGPVVACAVALPKGASASEGLWAQIKDSKKLSAKKRAKLHDFIVSNVAAYGVGVVSETEIDSLNILGATMKAMHLAIHECISRLPMGEEKEVEALVDGSYFSKYEPSNASVVAFHHTCVVKGDSLYLSIASASIVAKHTRDEYIGELVRKHPELGAYHIGKNKGYGTKAHLQALYQLGPHTMHRRSFKPLRENI